MLRDYTYLALGNIMCYPFLVARAIRIQRIQIAKGQHFSMSIREHTMVFCISGSANAHYVNHRIHADRSFPIHKNSLFYWEPVGDVRIEGETNNLILLILEFSLHSRQIDDAMPPDALPQDFFQAEMTTQLISMNLPFSARIDSSALLTYFVHEILQRIAAPTDQLCNFIESLLPAVIIHWLRISQKELHILDRVDSVKLSDDMANYEQIKAGQEILISDIEIWDSNPQNEGARKLFCFSASRFSHAFSAWGGEPLHTVEADTLLRIASPTKTPYSIILKSAGKVSSINLKPFQNTCYIRFRLYSNKPINLGIALYNCNTYLGLGHICHYTSPGIWQEECFPLLSDYQRLNSKLYIQRALDFIEEHFAQPIKRQDVARHLHISPGYLANLFYQNLGISMTQYIQQIRLAKALQLYNTTDLSLEQISFQTGFYDVSHLSKLFLQNYGVRPMLYRTHQETPHQEE